VRFVLRITTRTLRDVQKGGPPQLLPLLRSRLQAEVLTPVRPVTAMAFTVEDGVVTVIRMLSDPDRLSQIVPSWVA
jgi:hypothetical protein